MKVCFLSYTHPFNDTRILYKMAYSLRNVGFEVSHIAPDVGLKTKKRQWEDKGVKIVIYPMEGKRFFDRIKRFFNLLRKALKNNSDCFHCNEIESWLAGLLLKLFLKNKKVVFDVHEHYPSRFDEPHIKNWIGVIGKPILKIMFRILPIWTDHIIYAKRSVAKDFFINKKKLSYIFNYSPLWMHSKKIYKKNMNSTNYNGKIMSVHIGYLSKVRGWPQLLKAISLMKNKNLVLLCLGAVQEGSYTILERAKELNIENRIHLKPAIHYEKMFDLLLNSEIGLMLYQPGILNHIFAFPMKMYDYMLAGLPILGPNFAVEVVPVIEENKCGILVDTSNPIEIANALDWFCENREESKEMGNRGKIAIEKKYNWENEEKKLIRIYNNFV